jgi:hypothetical protein
LKGRDPEKSLLERLPCSFTASFYPFQRLLLKILRLRVAVAAAAAADAYTVTSCRLHLNCAAPHCTLQRRIQ